MPTPRAMFRIISVTCLLTRKALRFFYYYSRLAHVLNDERFCISTVYIIRMSFSASNDFYYCRYRGCLACVCVPVRSFFAATCI